MPFVFISCATGINADIVRGLQCFLTVPVLIYLTMTPRFPRTRKFANPYAMASLDGVFCILWLSAFAAVANWNSNGKCGDGCKLSKAVVGLGVVIWYIPSPRTSPDPHQNLSHNLTHLSCPSPSLSPSSISPS